MKAIVMGGSSDIGTALMVDWLNKGWEVEATTRSNPILELSPWDVFMTCIATMKPIAPFLECSFGEWEESVGINFMRHAKALHQALPYRNKNASVILWSGPGTNNAPLNYSAEIVAKIAQIKLCELLAAEIPDCRFVIIGPGWVNTKIHKETLEAGAAAGANLERTKEKLLSGCTKMSRIVDFVDWIIKQPVEVVSGRNFSIPNDIWGDWRLNAYLRSNPDAFKLRRHSNDWRPA
jgi:NAD(P)-dependent dehydrogenase (short-subunit alcohol dehydrogenase family)